MPARAPHVTEKGYIAILNDYTRYQEEPGNAYPEEEPPLSGPRQSKSDIGSQALPGS
jgi:hypothetical protein